MEQPKKKITTAIKNPKNIIRKIGQKKKSQPNGKASTLLPVFGKGESNPHFHTMRQAIVPRRKYPIKKMIDTKNLHFLQLSRAKLLTIIVSPSI